VVSADALAGRLAERGIELRHLTPGKSYAPCPECAKAKPRPHCRALRVTIEPDGGATWWCFRCGWHGGIPGTGWRPNHEIAARAPTSPKGNPFPSEAESPEPIADRGAAAAVARLWAQSLPIEPGTVAGRYLRGRGCRLPPAGADLRWHPRLIAPGGERWPGMVAAVTHAVTGELLTLHKTLLRPDGTDKAPVPLPRSIIKGTTRQGGVVRLWADDAVTTGLAIAEGIETALAAARHLTPIWACLDASGIGGLPVLAGIESLTIITDHDPAGLEAAHRCTGRWAAAGAELRCWLPPELGDDALDHLRRMDAANQEETAA